MANQYSYAREKLGQAIHILATGEGDVRSRLRSTYRHIRVLTPSRIPAALQEDLRWVKREMTKYGPLVDELGTVQTALEHTIGRIRNSTGKKIAERICSMYSKLPCR